MSALPYIIVTLGPTGAGKSTLIGKTIAYLELDKNYTKILVDDLVENNDKYKSRVREIILSLEKRCKTKNKNCDISNYYLNPDEELITAFNTAYYDVRQGNGCLPESNLTCDTQNDALLKRAIADNKNIVLELTGQTIPNWLLKAPFITAGYNVIFSYVLVKFDILLVRNTQRTLNSVKKFMNNNIGSVPGPRLPEIRLTKFKEIVYSIKSTLLDLYSSCIKSHTPEKCGSTRINRLLIFDNNGKEMQLAFDSAKDSNQIETVINAISPDNISNSKKYGGGTRKLKYGKRRNFSRMTRKRRSKIRVNKNNAKSIS